METHNIHKKGCHPNSEQLIGEPGSMVDDSGSTRTCETWYTCTLGLFWNVKDLFGQAMTDYAKGKFRDDPQALSLEA